LDLDFGGGDGLAPLSAFESRVSGVAIQNDGKILAVSSTESGSFALLRYDAEGRRDVTFGEKHGYTVTPTSFNGGGAQGLALEPNDRILLAGYGVNIRHEWTAILAAYRPNGALNRRFAHGGLLKLRSKLKGETPIELRSVAVLANGHIRAVGDFDGQIMLVGLLPNGRADPRFGGGDGIVLTEPDRRRHCACSYAADMQLDHRGRIVVAANVIRPQVREPAVLLRYRPNGRLDRSFGHHGLSRTALGSRLAGKAVAIQPNGCILLAGVYNVPKTGEARVAAVRYRPNGRLDRSFARRGFFTRDFGYEGVAYAALAQRDGRVVIGGRANLTKPPPSPDEFPSSIYDTAEVFLIRFMP
jgi:uncharacterized delta-60 repeat protein